MTQIGEHQKFWCSGRRHVIHLGGVHIMWRHKCMLRRVPRGPWPNSPLRVGRPHVQRLCHS
jgi:hypothetical protein